jgi:hypothetical protein
MSFRPIGVTTPTPGREPDIRIFFNGQLLLRSTDGQTCQAAVNHAAFQHVLSVEVRTKTPGKADAILMRHIGPLNFRQPNQPGMVIDFGGAGAAPAAFKFISSAQLNLETGDSQGADPQVAEQDFRWIINLEGGLFHGDQLNCSVFNTHNFIEMRGGEYYFYTALRSAPGLKFTRKGGGKRDLDFRRIGAVIGANVFLNENGLQSLKVTWNNGVEGADKVLTLSKPTGGVSHEIYIENTPLYQESTLTPPPTHSELIEYYKVLPDITGDARFNLEPSADPAPGQEGTPDIPCQSGVLDGV